MSRENLLLTLLIHENTENQYYRKHDLFVEKQKKSVEKIRHKPFDELSRDRQEYYLDTWFWESWRFNNIVGFAEIEMETGWTIVGHLYLPRGRATRVRKKPLLLNYACVSFSFEENNLDSLREAIITLADDLQSYISDRKCYLEFHPEIVKHTDFYQMLKRTQMRITDKIYIIPNVQANSYLIIEPDGLTLIDTGMPFSEKQTLRYIANLGQSAEEIKQILITHADLDHYGCLATLKEASTARAYASQAEAEAMAKGISSRPVNRDIGRFQAFMIRLMGKYLKPTPIQVDEILTDGQVLPVLDGLQVVETPGHSPSHLSFYAPSVRVLFCGDSMKSNDKGLRASRSRNNWNQMLANESVKKLSTLGAQIVCPGHGPVVRDANNRFPST